MSLFMFWALVCCGGTDLRRKEFVASIKKKISVIKMWRKVRKKKAKL